MLLLISDLPAPRLRLETITSAENLVLVSPLGLLLKKATQVLTSHVSSFQATTSSVLG